MARKEWNSMLRITADVFSGRPDPSWLITDESEVRTILRDLTTDPDLFAEGEPTDGRLGLRGFSIEPLDDQLALDFDITDRTYVAVGRARGTRSAEFSERLIGLMDRGVATPETAADALPLEAPLQEFLTAQLRSVTELASRNEVSATDELISAPPEEVAPAAVTCRIELGVFNPGFWNNNPTVRRSNNCYNYASNWRTNTFAQPGKGCGAMYTAITCGEVTRAALCDGMHHRFDCFPDNERPRYLVALVIAPGPGFIDYHWYRKQKEGFWGHKPGGTAARNRDNSNQVIYNPETADRGPYTIFCGYFYGCNTQRQRIR
jgi:hypothetical protein